MNTDKVIAVRTTKTVYRDGDKVIKVFDEHYSKADILNEALNQARVEETGLNIPKLLEVTKVGGRWAIVMEYIKGKTLAQLMQENPDKLDDYLNLFVDLQMEIHSKRAPLLNKLKDKMNRKISQADLTATIRYDLHTRLEAMPKHTTRCATATTTPATSSSRTRTANPMSSTGLTRRRATPPRTWRAPTSSSRCTARPRSRTNISTSSA